MGGTEKSGGAKGTRPAEVLSRERVRHRETVGDLPRGVVFSDAHGAQAVEPGHAAAGMKRARNSKASRAKAYRLSDRSSFSALETAA